MNAFETVETRPLPYLAGRFDEENMVEMSWWLKATDIQFFRDDQNELESCNFRRDFGREKWLISVKPGQWVVVKDGYDRYGDPYVPDVYTDEQYKEKFRARDIRFVDAA